LIRGSATHRAAATGLLLQMQTATVSPVELFEDVGATEIDKARHAGATLSREEVSIGVSRTWGQLKDKVVRLAGGYGRLLAPRMRPRAVERRLTVDGVIPGIRLRGTLDVVDQTDTGEAVRDVKTSERQPRKDQADLSDQLSFYHVLRGAETGATETPVSLDYVVIQPRTGDVTTARLESRRGPADTAALVARIQTAQRAVAAGIFIPAPRDAWYCSIKWCEFAPTCPYFSARDVK
jgi:hypothetical protein